MGVASISIFYIAQPTDTISMKPHPGIRYIPKTAGMAECPSLSAYPLK
jgi:hypothetical protein